MGDSYSALCDEFYVNMRLGTQMKMATDRATLISFFERMQKIHPRLVNFQQDAKNCESTMEEDRENNAYRWLSVEANRLSCGYFNPPTCRDAYALGSSVLEVVPYYLSISPVDLDYLDILWGFDYQCKGNHHELIAEALLGDSPVGKLLETPGSKAVNYELSAIVSLSEDSRTHARVWVEPRTSAQQIRSNHFSEDALSVYVIVRQWAGGRKLPDLHELYEQLPRQGEQFIDERVVEHFLAPIREAIGRRR